MRKVPIASKVTEEIKAKLVECAKAQNKTISQVLGDIVAEYFQTREKVQESTNEDEDEDLFGW